jgi:integrase/recombinase XerD
LNITTSISPHKWRHTFATRFRSQGGNLEVLYALLGHQNLRMTQKYLHLNQKLMHPEYHRVMNQQPSKNQTLE